MSPHILDYYHVSAIGGRNAQLATALIGRGHIRLFDVQENDLVNAHEEVGAVARRQRLQRQYTLRNEEFISPDLKPLLLSHAYWWRVV